MAEHDDTVVEGECKYLVGLERALRAFAYYLIDENFDARQSKIRYVVPYGNYVTPYARRLFESAFGGAVYDRYGMSEIFGGAAQFEPGEYYLFDPSIIPEVVGSDSKLPIENGVGSLILTALYPFQQSQPLIRYDTGDLVEVCTLERGGVSEAAIRPLGRARYGVPGQRRDEWLLVPAEVYSILDETPEMERSPLFRDAEQVSDKRRIGHLRYNVQYSDCADKRRIVLRVELKAAVRDSSDGIVEGLRARVLQNSPNLQLAIARGEATFEVRRSRKFPTTVISYRE
jgi:phenylacetate-coenzyme A ligase PaaK-like adenylate-forming protein